MSAQTCPSHYGPAPMSSSIQPEPFWNRLNAIALYPFKDGALVSLIVLSVVSLLSFFPGPGGIIFTVVVWFAAYRYVFEILVHTANGQMLPPELTTHTDNGVVWRFFGLWLLYWAAVQIVGFLAGPVGGSLVMLLLTAMMPGAIMSLAIDGNLPHAINPTTVLEMIRRIGAPYFAAFALLFVIQVSAENAGALLARFMPTFVAELLVMATTLWGLFATFHLMGYLVLQYHEVLGFVPEYFGRAKPKLRTRDSDLMEAVQEHISEGHVETARSLLEEEMRERAVTIEAHELYRKLLKNQGDKAALLEHAVPYLNVLLLEKKDRRALGLLRDTLDANPNFTPHQTEDGDRLAQRARDLGQSRLACDLWLAMLKRWPRDPARVNWAISSAELLAQRDLVPLAREVLERSARGLEDEEQKARIAEALEQLAIP